MTNGVTPCNSSSWIIFCKALANSYSLIPMTKIDPLPAWSFRRAAGEIQHLWEL